MEQPLNKIRRLSKSLPEGDIKFAEKYITSREFHKLLEIVESDIYLVQQNELADNPKEKYINISIDKLVELREALDEYISFIEIPEYEEDDWTYH